MKDNQTQTTVQLPKTQFPMRGNLPHREPEMLAWWESIHLYAALEEKNKNKTRYILHDGPPYANGHIHIGHVLNKVLKDFVVKYRMMTGHFSPYIPGWDCHGLPIEHQLMKERHLSKHAVTTVDFRKDAAAYARKFIDIQREEFKRLGVIGDWEHPYLTMDPRYEKTIVHVFHELLKKGYIVRRKKPVLWCAECETALAEAEVEYEDHQSPSIYVAFDIIPEGTARALDVLKKFSKASLIIWTTTPWTIPANVAIAVKPGRTYTILKREGSDQRYLVETSLWEKNQDVFMKQLLLQRVPNDPPALNAEDLADIRCKHPFVQDRVSRVILADFVDTETGTGAVHIAPGHGEIDYVVGLTYNLPIISPVDHAGRFTSEMPLWKGKKVFVTNDEINELLQKKGNLLYAATTQHSYPHCWRCKNPVIFRATEQWFLSIEHERLRERILAAIKRIEWIPSAGEARITGMVATRPDWCLSRQRLWGTPMTIIYCSACGEPLIQDTVMRTIESVIEKEGSMAWYTNDVSAFLPPQTQCTQCGGTAFKKETDILDVWFDSGVSHEAVLQSDPRLSWPADLYLEGSDQHRGWFQTSIIPAVALKDKAPYRSVLTHGFTVDGAGKKMSKSVGNVVYPEEIIKEYGSDILRLWVAAADYREDIRISTEIIHVLVDVYRRIRNTLRFLLGNLNDFSPSGDYVTYTELMEIDQWALNQLQKLIQEVHAGYDLYEFHRVWIAINTFCSHDMSSLYFDILKDRLYTWDPAGKERRSAQTVLYEILHSLTRLLAPLLSFTIEEAWQVFKKEHTDSSWEQSVFLSDMPQINPSFVSEKLSKKWDQIFNIRSHVNAQLEKARKQGVIGSSLEAEVTIIVSSEELFTRIHAVQDMLDAIFIVSKVSLQKDSSGEEMTIRITHAPGHKCVRCWRWQEEVTEYVKLCSRCRSVMGK